MMDSVLKKGEPGAAPLRNDAHERFCGAATGYSGGDPVSATDAYLAAYPRTKSRDAARANAARTAARAEVRARMAWMRSQLAESALVDSEALRRKLLNDRLTIIDKTKGTCHKPIALAAMRDVEKSMGLVAPGGAGTPEADGASGQAVAADVGRNILAALAAVRKAAGGDAQSGQA